jgi:hypothetical protein
MIRSEAKFAQLLTEGIHRIRIRESKSVKAVQDELGYAMGRDGGSSIEYWRKGHIPLRASEVENLAREIVRRGRLERDWLDQFLRSAAYPGVAELLSEMFAPDGATSTDRASDLPDYHDLLRDSALDQLIPFIIGPPVVHPRQFFGRESELRRLFALLKNFPLQNAAIIGPQRSGKTSLLHHLRLVTTAAPTLLRPGQRSDWLRDPQKYTWIFIDFQDTRMRNLELLLRKILTALKLPVPAPCNLSNFMDVISHRVRTPTIILMDEIGAGLESPELNQEFWWSMRALCSNLADGNLAFILTAHDVPARVADQYGKPSPFFNIIGHTFMLGPLTIPEACDLVGSSPQPFTQEDTDWIIEQSRRWPALLQVLCYSRLVAFDDGCVDESWKEEGLRQMDLYRHLLNQK